MPTKPTSPITRRTFIAGLGASVAAPYIIPASAFGATGETAPSNRIHLGLVGCGGQGKGLLENALSHKNVRVIAVCDVDQTRLDETKQLVDGFYGDTACAAVRDYRELVTREDIDAVICATPDHWHALVCIDAAHHGKDIYCEKPLTWSLAEGQAVVKAVQGNRRVFQTGSMQRSGRQFKHAAEIVRNGELGDITDILVSLPDFDKALWVDEFPAPPAELDWEMYVGPAEWAPFHPKRYHWDWRWWMGFGGGQMMDWVGHHGDIAHMAMDWDNTGPLEVEGLRWDFGTERNNLYDAPSRYMYRCKYAGGVTMTVANASDMPANFARPGSLGTMFFGERGKWLYVDRGGIEASHERILRPKRKDGDFQFRRGSNHMTDFINSIVSRAECLAPVNAGHRSASIGHLGKLACTLGVSFKWDPETETITDNPALNPLLGRRYRGDWKLPA
jgi:predicted dehydrogenase